MIKKSKLGSAEARTKRTLSALSVVQNNNISRRGRPKGTYKYGTPIENFKKLQSQRKAFFELQKLKRDHELLNKGYSQEAIEQVRRNTSVVNEDPEVAFRRKLAETTVSPNTLAILERLKRIQNKGAIDEIEMQRRIRERRMVAQAGNLLKGKNLFGPDSNKLNILEMEGNILTAPNVFKEIPGNKILQPRRVNILQTSEAGNTLKF